VLKLQVTAWGRANSTCCTWLGKIVTSDTRLIPGHTCWLQGAELSVQDLALALSTVFTPDALTLQPPGVQLTRLARPLPPHAIHPADSMWAPAAGADTRHGVPSSRWGATEALLWLLSRRKQRSKAAAVWCSGPYNSTCDALIMVCACFRQMLGKLNTCRCQAPTTQHHAMWFACLQEPATLNAWCLTMTASTALRVRPHHRLAPLLHGGWWRCNCPLVASWSVSLAVS
jgi:hypothetical protein